uniref:Uncharacterized protein n=1 Tax=viral metagenome TaxID=1070528 RepID=A0A6H1ZDJ0_9ZZZZ
METADITTLAANVSNKDFYCWRPDDKPDKRTYWLERGRTELEKRLKEFNSYVHAVNPMGLDYLFIILEVIKTILISDIRVDNKGIDEIYLMIADRVVSEMESKKEDIKKQNDMINTGHRVAGAGLIVPPRFAPKN